MWAGAEFFYTSLAGWVKPREGACRSAAGLRCACRAGSRWPVSAAARTRLSRWAPESMNSDTDRNTDRWVKSSHGTNTGTNPSRWTQIVQQHKIKHRGDWRWLHWEVHKNNPEMKLADCSFPENTRLMKTEEYTRSCRTSGVKYSHV